MIAVCSFLAYSVFTQKQITTESTRFNIPSGYHENGSNEFGDIRITNGTDDIYVAEYNDSNINYYIKTIETLLDSKNITYSITNFTYNHVLIYKLTVVNDTNYIRYWYNDGGRTYCIYTWDGNLNMDDIVFKLIESRKQVG